MKYLFTLYAIAFYAFNTFAQGSALSWHQLTNTGLVAPSYRFDDIYFVNELTGFAVSTTGLIQKTTDGATTWNTVYTGTSNTTFRAIEFTDDGKYGLATALNGTVVRSSDGGDTWTDISTSMPDTGSSKNRICGIAHYGYNFYGAGWWGSSLARFYSSSDTGKTWQVKYIDTNLASGLVDIATTSANTIFATGHRKHANKIENTVLRSTDAGQNWTRVFSDTLVGGRIWKVQFLDSQLGFGAVEPYYKQDTVCFIKTTDGGSSWTLHPAGKLSNITIGGYGVQGIGFLNPERGWIGGYFKGIFETVDSGKTWTQDTSLCLNLNRIFRANDSVMYAGGFSIYGLGQPNSISMHQPGSLKTSHTLYPAAPNPSKGKIKINFDIQHTTNVLIEVANIESRTVYPVNSGFLKPGHYSFDWDNPDAPAGNYILWLGTDEIPLVQKFIIHK